MLDASEYILYATLHERLLCLELPLEGIGNQETRIFAQAVL